MSSAGLGTSSWWQLFLFGGVAACTAEAATTPIDALKTRLQLDAAPRARGPAAAAARALALARAAGVSGLYAGLKPALLRQATYGAARMGLYEPVKVALAGVVGGGDGGGGGGGGRGGGGRGPGRGPAPASPAFVVKLLAGALSGALAAAACAPADLIKTRMQAGAGVGAAGGAAGGAPTRGVVAAARRVLALEGVAGLWAGWAPAAARAAVVAAVEIGCYDELKGALPRVVSPAAFPPGDARTHVAASVLAGAACSAVAAPVDLVKVRVQAAGRALSPWAAARAAAAGPAGALALWSGAGADFARRTPHCVVAFATLEALRARFGGGGGV